VRLRAQNLLAFSGERKSCVLTNVFCNKINEGGKTMKKLSLIIATILMLSCLFTFAACNQCANGHKWDEGKVLTEPTCGKDGEKECKCTICGETKTEKIFATGNHSWGDGVVTTQPQCEADGVRTFTCSVCGATKTETEPRTGHSPNAELLYEVDGDKLYSYNKCANCSEKLNRTEVANTAIVADVSALTSALSTASDGDTIALQAGTYALESPLSLNKSVTVVGVGEARITTSPVYVGANCDVTIRNVVFSTPTNANNNASSVYASSFAGKLHILGCTFLDTQWDSLQITPVQGAEIVIDGCRFENANVAGHRFIHIECSSDLTGNTSFTVAITNNTFGSAEKIANALIDVDYIDYVNLLTAYGNTFADNKDTLVEGEEIFVCKTYPGDYMSAADAYDLFVADAPAA